MFSKPLTDLIHKYKTPNGQISLLFNVPIDQLTEVKKVLQEHFKNSEDTYKIRWRGPRQTHFQHNTLKKDAIAFSVYTVKRRQECVLRHEAVGVTPSKYVVKYKLI